MLDAINHFGTESESIRGRNRMRFKIFDNEFNPIPNPVIGHEDVQDPEIAPVQQHPYEDEHGGDGQVGIDQSDRRRRNDHGKGDERHPQPGPRTLDASEDVLGVWRSRTFVGDEEPAGDVRHEPDATREGEKNDHEPNQPCGDVEAGCEARGDTGDDTSRARAGQPVVRLRRFVGRFRFHHFLSMALELGAVDRV
jgi:hypothetical protein